MIRLFSILYLTFALWLLCGCRCERQTSSFSHRTDAGLIDVRSRSLSQLWDSLAERQTIRIEYWYPYALGPGYNISDCRPADSTTTASNGSRPSGTGCSEPAIKSIEITTERNSGSSVTTIKDSTNVSHNATTETLQQEAASEARQDNGTWATIAVVAAVAGLAYFVLKEVLS